MSPITNRGPSLVQRLGGGLKRSLDGLLDLLWPPQCLCCRAPLDDAQVLLCQACGEHLNPAEPIEAIDALHKIWAFWRYDDAAAHLIQGWKFNKQRQLERALPGLLSPEQLHTARLQLTGSTTGLILVPLPSHPARVRERGFDHTRALAKALARAFEANSCPTQVWTGIERWRHTEHQVGADRSQRRANLQGAFRLKAGRQVAGMSFVLVDDVLTTGATAIAAAEPLIRGGASRVALLVLAHTPRGSAADSARSSADAC